MDDQKEKDNLTDVAEMAAEQEVEVENKVPEGRVEGEDGDIVTLGN